MWACKHCKKEFNYTTISEKANHSRWCDKNINRNNWKKYQASDTKYGKFKNFSVCCAKCNKSFNVKEREKKFPKKSIYYCSRKCANSIGGIAKRELYGLTGYINIAKKYYHEKCAVCGTKDVLDVHHIDENRNNYHPSNLIFLCPNDHARLHRNKCETVLNIIEGHGTAWGGRFTCNEDSSWVQIPNAPPKYFKV